VSILTVDKKEDYLSTPFGLKEYATVSICHSDGECWYQSSGVLRGGKFQQRPTKGHSIWKMYKQKNIPTYCDLKLRLHNVLNLAANVNNKFGIPIIHTGNSPTIAERPRLLHIFRHDAKTNSLRPPLLSPTIPQYSIIPCVQSINE